jgi:hypothetical protein
VIRIAELGVAWHHAEQGRIGMVSKFLTAIAATTLAAAPVAANAAQNASALSVAKSVRATAPTKGGQKLAGGGIVFALLAAAIVAGGVIIAVDDNNSDSN